MAVPTAITFDLNRSCGQEAFQCRENSPCSEFGGNMLCPASDPKRSNRPAARLVPGMAPQNVQQPLQ